MKKKKAETTLVASYKQDINFTKYTLPVVKSNLCYLQLKAFICGHRDVTLSRHAVRIYLTSSCSSLNMRNNRLGKYLPELNCTIWTKLTQKIKSFISILKLSKMTVISQVFSLLRYFVLFGSRCSTYRPLSLNQTPLNRTEFQSALRGIGKDLL